MVAAVASPNDVVDDLDAQESPRLSEPIGDFLVFSTRPRVSRRMVVTNHDGDGSQENRALEHLAWMDERGGRRSDRNDGMSRWSMTTVEIEGNEVFSRVVGDDSTGKMDEVFRTGHWGLSLK